MIKLLTTLSIKKLTPLYITQLQLSQVPLEERQGKKIIKN